MSSSVLDTQTFIYTVGLYCHCYSGLLHSVNSCSMSTHKCSKLIYLKFYVCLKCWEALIGSFSSFTDIGVTLKYGNTTLVQHLNFFRQTNERNCFLGKKHMKAGGTEAHSGVQLSIDVKNVLHETFFSCAASFKQLFTVVGINPKWLTTSSHS